MSAIRPSIGNGTVRAVSPIRRDSRRSRLRRVLRPHRVRAATSDDFFGDGSRLKAQWRQVPGTPKVLRGWYDTQVRSDCSWAMTDGDSIVRCLPSPHADTGFLWADADCTVPLALVGPDQRHAWEQAPTDCTWTTRVVRVFEVGPPVPPTTPVYWNLYGRCELADVAVPSNRVGAEIPLDSFVASTSVTPNGTGRIVPLIGRANDGSWQRQDLIGRDTVLETTVFYISAYGSRWYPLLSSERYAEPSLFFSDAACTSSGLARLACASTTHLFTGFSDFPATSCVPSAPIYSRLGASVEPSSVHTTFTGSCERVATAGFSGGRYVVPGPVVPDEEFAAVSLTEIGSDSVKLRMAGTTDGEALLPTSDYYDTTHQAVCNDVAAADGRRRCLPVASSNASTYFDSACIRRAVVLQVGCAVPTYVSIPSSEMSRVFPVLAASSSTYFLNDGSGCREQPAQLVHELGAEIPAADFVEVTLSPPF